MPDREKTIKRLEHLSEWLFHLYQVVCDGDAPDYYDAYKTVDDAISLLKEQPDIVRCSDCKHYGYHNMINVDGFCYCLKRHEYPHPDWHCADGERR
jgi:hypothetical protein